MKKVLAAVILSLFPLQVISNELKKEDVIIVSVPPVYKDGEHYMGKLILLDGQESLMEMWALKGKAENSKIYVHTQILSFINRGLQAYSVLDPENAKYIFFREGYLETGLETFCGSESLYPIFLGKTYNCTKNVEVNGEKVKVDTEIIFNKISSDLNGKIKEFCSLNLIKTYEMIKKIQICFSPDSKWTTSVRELEIITLSKV